MKKSLMWSLICKGMGLLFIIFNVVNSIFEHKMVNAMIDEAVDEKLGKNDESDEEE